MLEEQIAKEKKQANEADAKKASKETKSVKVAFMEGCNRRRKAAGLAPAYSEEEIALYK